MDKLSDKNCKDYEYESLLYARKALNEAKEWHLETEVWLESLSYALTHPNATYVDCIDYGLAEWIK